MPWSPLGIPLSPSPPLPGCLGLLATWALLAPVQDDTFDPDGPPSENTRIRISPSVHVDLDEQREIKVKLPIELHLKLHALKITRRKGLSQVVLEALEQYLAKQGANEE